MAVIESAIKDNQNIIKSRNIVAATQSKSKAAELALTSLLNVYGIMETALEGSIEPSAETVKQDSSIFVVDPVVDPVVVKKYPVPSEAAKSMLRETPSLSEQFNKVYGPAAADLILNTSSQGVQY